MPSFSHSWLPFIYLYVCGGIIFFTGMYIIHKSNSLDLRLKKNRRWRKVLYFGFFYFMIIHAILIIAAIYW
ncbi:MAG TPA: hypothetical protein PLZ15_11485 [Melioribacteraceae bacterium]|nr:hypothetical protein [Melioribacteraceae bacterium]